MRNLISVAALFIAVSSYASPSITWEGAVEGSVRQRASTAPDADVVLLITGEQRGEAADCGCPARPLGGLARFETYAQQVEKQADVPVLRIGAGHLFDDTIGGDGRLRPDVRTRNEAIATVVGGWDAVNIGASDVPFVDDRALDSVVSANVLATDDRAQVRVREVEVAGQTLALIGLAGPGLAFLPPEHHRQVGAVEGLESALSTTSADVVVVVGIDLGEDLAVIAGNPRVDVLVTAGRHHERWPPESLGEAVWVRTVDQGQVVSDIRLSLADGLTQVRVRQVDLDARIPDDRSTRRALERVVVPAWP